MAVSTCSPLISVLELQKKINNKDLIILDARFSLANANYGNEVYNNGHLPKALHVDLEKDLCAEITPLTGRHPLKTQEELAEFMRSLGINNDSHIVIYDEQPNMFAIHLWWVLRSLGHESVQVLDGGLKEFPAEGEFIELGRGRVIEKQGDFTIRSSQFDTIQADDITRFLETGEGEFCIVDARGAARYRGEVEPLDPVAGHIPTAINRPFELNLNDKGLFKSAEDLKQEWQEFLKNDQEHVIVHQCGSGISACHNLFAMYYAGLGETMVYPGSWSQWCKDSTRPVALG